MDQDSWLTTEQAIDLHHQETVNGSLVMWVVTWNPSDYPGQAVARPNLIGPGAIIALRHVIVAQSLAELRDLLPDGLTRLNRDANDDPVIIEVWV